MSTATATRAQTTALRRAVRVLRGDNLPGADCACASARDAARPWLCDAHVQGFGVGEKIRRGKRAGTPALRVYVDEKVGPGEVAAPIPPEWEAPGTGPVPIDVVPIGRVVAEAFTDTVRPFMPGCGMAHQHYTFGTLGCIVRDCGGGTARYALSNAHVFAQSGAARPGDGITQCAPGDNAKGQGARVARLTRFVPIIADTADYRNTVDAAIAEIDDPAQADAAIRLLGHPPRGVLRAIRAGMRVRKVGRTTELTEGVIEDVDFHTEVGYPRPGGSGMFVAKFRDLVLCTRYTEAGDSGSLVLSQGGHAVGLHMAGMSGGSIFCKIGNVLDSLGVELET